MTFPVISHDSQRGTYAEHQAATWLSRQCLVRPVASGTDIGVDLYCESLAGNSPFQHFWVQVKAISDRNLRETDNGQEAFYDFETRHLRYWIRQPVPVYGFLVPVLGWPPPSQSVIYGVSISRNLLTQEIPDQGTHRMSTLDCFEESSLDDDLTEFVTRVVPADTSALMVPHGALVPIEYPDERAETHLPRGLALGYLDEIEDTIRQTLEICLAELMIREDMSADDHVTRRRISRILSEYDDHLNAIGASMLAQSAFFDGNFDRANYLFNIVESLVERAPVDEETRASRRAELDRQREICNRAIESGYSGEESI